MSYTALQQMQHDLRILRVILVPRIEQRFARSMGGDRRDKVNVMPLSGQEVREWPMTIAAGLKPHFTPWSCRFKLMGEFIEIREGIRDAQRGSSPVRELDKYMMPGFGDIDRHETELASALLKRFMVAASREMC